MSETTFLADDVSSLSRHAFVAVTTIVALVGGFFWWAVTTEISGAVVSAGTLVVESSSKTVQHQEGGTVRAIYVAEGDHVELGQPLLRLDDIAIRANLEIVSADLGEALVKQARLEAALAEATNFELPAELHAADDRTAILLDNQRQILRTAFADRDGRERQLSEQIAQLEHQVEGLTIQQQSAERGLRILSSRAAAVDSLLARQLIAVREVDALHIQVSASEGEVGRLVAAISEAHARIAERRIEIDQLRTGFANQALEALESVRQTIATSRQQKVVIEDRLTHALILAPEKGIVHQLAVHTVGGVVGAGETLMTIVPNANDLRVAVRIAPDDVDQVGVGQAAELRFTGFDGRDTPEAKGQVEKLSPDASSDPTTGRAYFAATIRILPEQEFDFLEGARLAPGMPVEVFLTTGSRSVLSYLLRPLVEETQLAFRE